MGPGSGPGQELALFPPPASAASLYVGKVMHARLKPKPHRFAYSVFSLLIDLDRLGEAGRMSRLFSVGRFNLLSFRESDHGSGDGALSAQIRAALDRAGVDLDGGRVLLLCYPRLLGYVFNPLATYWCYGADDALKAVVYEVTNTFHERHAYVAPVRDGELGLAGLRQSRDKLMYVSPFLDMEMAYAFRLRPPGESVRLRILESDAEGPILSATFAGERQALTSASVLKLCAGFPLMTLKVMAAIHWEALRLWVKGIRLADHPPAPTAQTSVDAPGPIRHGRPAMRQSAPSKNRTEAASAR
ncbi:DUF1365 domain-containing protein [Methylopila sp. M107]|uniref:DUF1365 domain-containing protein n=1 Tax=Methylopila sp. M107 TaxID=1101190 RepID=UPI0024742D89|nr:DUF1365 domain-containing protein [Methylopila sp. M107]